MLNPRHAAALALVASRLTVPCQFRMHNLEHSACISTVFPFGD